MQDKVAFSFDTLDLDPGGHNAAGQLHLSRLPHQRQGPGVGQAHLQRGQPGGGVQELPQDLETLEMLAHVRAHLRLEERGCAQADHALLPPGPEARRHARADGPAERRDWRTNPYRVA